MLPKTGSPSLNKQDVGQPNLLLFFEGALSHQYARKRNQIKTTQGNTTSIWVRDPFRTPREDKLGGSLSRRLKAEITLEVCDLDCG